MEFVEEYISKHSQPIKNAKEELVQIDVQIRNIQELQARRFNLIQVLDAFGDESYKKRKNNSKFLSEDVQENHDYDSKILQVLSSGPLNIRDILTKIEVFDSDPLALRAIKKLAETEKIKRNAENCFYLAE